MPWIYFPSSSRVCNDCGCFQARKDELSLLLPRRKQDQHKVYSSLKPTGFHVRYVLIQHTCTSNRLKLLENRQCPFLILRRLCDFFLFAAVRNLANVLNFCIVIQVEKLTVAPRPLIHNWKNDTCIYLWTGPTTYVTWLCCHSVVSPILTLKHWYRIAGAIKTRIKPTYWQRFRIPSPKPSPCWEWCTAIMCQARTSSRPTTPRSWPSSGAARLILSPVSAATDVVAHAINAVYLQ